MSELLLTGLDGKNPLAFLAALGALDALADHTPRGQPEPTLAWRATGTFQPVIAGGGLVDRASLVDVVVADLAGFRDEPAIERLCYPKGGDGAMTRDLKPPPRWFADYLRALVREERRRGLAFAASFATDVATDNNGNAKPTALHFTAGQQEMLSMVRELMEGVTPEDVEEALFGPWGYRRSLPVLSWDNSSLRDYALRAGDPSKDKKLGVPGADWLAFRGLPFLRVAPVGDRVETTGCQGGWKTSTFRWPLWNVPLPRSVIRSLLTSRELFEAPPGALEARGIAIVLESAIRRSDQGGYGSFSPSRPAERHRA